MKFRTEIEPTASRNLLRPETPVTLIGSCFADNIGSRLERDRFDAVHNPLGPLYNPMSVASCLNDALAGRRYTPSDFVIGPRGYHCLDYATRYSGADATAIAESLNDSLELLHSRLTSPGILTVTFGTAYAYYLDGDTLVGNCHKFPANRFDRRRLGIEDISAEWEKLLSRLPSELHVILTVSPVRHLADGLHGNRLSKAVLMLATEQICNATGADYFPAYEILEDDLRDYRFYDSDLKHPSEMAAEYIYDHFMDTYMTRSGRSAALEGRRLSAAGSHRRILTD